MNDKKKTSNYIEVVHFYNQEKKFHQDAIKDIDKILEELDLEKNWDSDYQCYDVGGIPGLNEKRNKRTKG